MYSIYGDDVCLYNNIFPTEKTTVLNPTLKLKDNAAGSLEITLSPANVGYSTIKHLSSTLTVFQDDVEIWSGRVIGEKKDFFNNRRLTCEGELAYLNDTTQPPAEYHNRTVQQFLQILINEHNSKVAANKRFTLGVVTVLSNLYRFTNNESTLECINEKLVKRLGGHIRVRQVDGIRYLDYLQDFPNINPQEIRFGKNLLDFTREWDLTDLITVVMPRGEHLETSPIEGLEAYLDVTSVNGGSRYVTNETAISQFGWIEGIVDWDDVTIASNLLSKARNYLSSQQFDAVIIEASAVDLRYLGLTAQAINLLDQVRCISTPHGMDKLFPVTELNIPLDRPDGAMYTLGETIQQNTTDSSSIRTGNGSLIETLNSQPSADTLLTEARQNSTNLINMKTNGYVTIHQNVSQGYSESLTISAQPWSSNPSRYWVWNINGLGYTNNRGASYLAAITMDGAIVADRITVGTMSADRIRTGTLRSQDGNVVWNLNSGGSLTINRGSISLGSGLFSVDNYGYLRATYGVIGGFTISSSSIRNDSMNLDHSGLHLSYQNTAVGRFAGQSWIGYPSHRGLMMCIEPNTYYTGWSRDDAGSGTSIVKLLYVSRTPGTTDYAADRVHFGTNSDHNNYTAYRTWVDPYTGGAASVGSNIAECFLPYSFHPGGAVNKYYTVRIRNGFVCVG